MKSPTEIFYLVLLSLLKISQCAHKSLASEVQIPRSDACMVSPESIISDACTSFLELDRLNVKLKDTITDITHNTDFFSYYRLNLFGKECPFWRDNNGVCGNIACVVNTLDNEEQIPLIWRAKELGKLEGPTAVHPTKQLQENRSLESPLDGMLGANVGESCVVEYDDESDEREYCIPEDESIGSRGDYVSLVDNPERFTGYAGEGAKQIWDAIYRENCFSSSSLAQSVSLSTSSYLQRSAANELQSVIRRRGKQGFFQESQNQLSNIFHRPTNGYDYENECLEKRVFYRIVSGMHTSISAHICAEYLNQMTGKWSPNLQCYKDRLHRYPDRVSNLYFNYAVVLRAINKLGPYLKEYTFCSHDTTQNLITKSKVQSLMLTIATAPQVFNESLMFVNGEGPGLKEDFKNRFRNISRIMDCVGCDKCRLWGKLQTAGYGAALKVLFETDNHSDDVPKLKRTEIVALFNTLARISSSLKTIENFRAMIEEESRFKNGDISPIKSKNIRKLRHLIPDELSIRKDGIDDRKDLDKQKESNNPPIAVSLRTELDIFWRVTKYVIRSWVNFPVKLWEIIKTEIPRAWDNYIGLPVKPRKWVFKRPNLNEL